MVLLFLEGAQYHKGGVREAQIRYKNEEHDTKHPGTWRNVLESLLISFSDQSIVTGQALLYVTYYWASCSISAYHYNLVCDLVLVSIVVHLCSITAVEQYLQNWWLGALRLALILLSFVFVGLVFVQRNTPEFPLSPPVIEDKNDTLLVRPAVCFMAENLTALYDDTVSAVKGGAKGIRKGLQSYIVLVVFFAAATVLSMAQAILGRDKFQRRMFQLRFALFWLRVAVAMAATVVSIMSIGNFSNLQTWMSVSGWFGEDDDDETTINEMPCTSDERNKRKSEEMMPKL
ncbi:hypothetical protein BDY21DRAFT_375595 [Lineolata rhizophorae]|uniref:Uncharacterized protein n=1 Tax=Lineolata rhizophorae TaxID=578093 RepID=A0A6A6NL04_9PEZI|nr:hypothetical protein BDY21DRAFT_375595 [Lineolata rhizophorae]